MSTSQMNPFQRIAHHLEHDADNRMQLVRIMVKAIADADGCKARQINRYMAGLNTQERERFEQGSATSGDAKTKSLNQEIGVIELRFFQFKQKGDLKTDFLRLFLSEILAQKTVPECVLKLELDQLYTVGRQQHFSDYEKANASFKRLLEQHMFDPNMWQGKEAQALELFDQLPDAITQNHTRQAAALAAKVREPDIVWCGTVEPAEARQQPAIS